VLIANAYNTDSPQILYPPDGAVFALDPDIPEDQERIFFESRGNNNHIIWMLDGESLGTNVNYVSWKPISGSHTLSLLDFNNDVIESVSFVVKGQ